MTTPDSDNILQHSVQETIPQQSSLTLQIAGEEFQNVQQITNNQYLRSLQTYTLDTNVSVGNKFFYCMMHFSWFGVPLCIFLIFYTFSMILNTHINCFYMILDLDENNNFSKRNQALFGILAVFMFFLYYWPICYSELFVRIFKDCLIIQNLVRNNIKIGLPYFTGLFAEFRNHQFVNIIGDQNNQQIQIYYESQTRVQAVLSLIFIFSYSVVIFLFGLISLLVLLLYSSSLAYDIIITAYVSTIFPILLQSLSYFHVITLKETPFICIPFFRFSRFVINQFVKLHVCCSNKYKATKMDLEQALENTRLGSIIMSSILTVFVISLIIAIFSCKFISIGIVILCYYLMSYLIIIFDLKIEDESYKHQQKIFNTHPIMQIINYIMGVILVLTILISLIFVSAVKNDYALYSQKHNSTVQEPVLYSNLFSEDKIRFNAYCVTDAFGLTFQDYTILANVAYGSNNTEGDFKSFETFKYFSKSQEYYFTYFNQRNEHISVYYPKDPASDLPTFYGFRGTNNVVDAYHDIQIFIPYVAITVDNFLMLNFYHNYITTILIKFYQLTGEKSFANAIQYENRVLSSFENIVNSNSNSLLIKAIHSYDGTKFISYSKDECLQSPNCRIPINFPKENVLFLGHSLGGALAKRVGTAYPFSGVISISGPGIYITPTQYSSLTARIRNIKPNRDIVPKVGVQEGSIITIPCQTPSFLTCHLIATTICQFARYCSNTNIINDADIGCR